MKRKRKYGAHTPVYGKFMPPPPPKPKKEDDVIRGHRLTDEEANERIWREIDQAFLAIESIPIGVVEEALKQEIEKLWIIKVESKEKEK